MNLNSGASQHPALWRIIQFANPADQPSQKPEIVRSNKSSIEVRFRSHSPLSLFPFLLCTVAYIRIPSTISIIIFKFCSTSPHRRVCECCSEFVHAAASINRTQRIAAVANEHQPKPACIHYEILDALLRCKASSSVSFYQLIIQ